MAPQLRVEHGLDERPQHEGVVSRDEVDRRAHDDGSHRLALEQQPLQLLRTEGLEAGPQADVGIARHLRLQPDELANDVERRPLDALEQVLPRQRRPVQLAVGEDGAQLPVVEKCW